MTTENGPIYHNILNQIRCMVKHDLSEQAYIYLMLTGKEISFPAAFKIILDLTYIINHI